jgi:DNA primase
MFNFRVLGDLGELRQLFHELWPADTFDSGRCVRCPFHADHEPSLSFYVATDGKVRYHCFGCQAHGDALDAVMRAKGMGFAEAAAFLAAREGTDVSSLMPRLQANRHEQAWLNALADHLRECLHTHSQGERVRAWLEKRGIPQATWARLPVGLYPSSPEVGQFCRGRGMADDFIQLHIRRGHKWEGSLAFLYHRDYVNVSRVKLRVPEGRETEWLGKSGSDIGFFGLSCFQYRRDSRTLLVEGEFDLLVPQALALIEHGKTTNLLCRSGGAMRDKQALRKLASLGITHGYIFPDHDRGGLQYVEALLAHADGAPELLVVDPPEYQPGEDPAAFARRLNRFSTFQEAVQARRLLPWEWMARRIAAKFTATPEGQVKAREETIAYAKAHKLSGTALGDFLRAVAAVTGATVDELKVELSLAEPPSWDSGTVHLLEIENADLDGTSIQTPIRVVGVGEAFFVPKAVRAVCRGNRGEEKECHQCPLAATGEHQIDITPTSRELLECIQATERAKLQVLRRLADARCPRFSVHQLASQTVTELIAYPQAQTLDMSDRSAMIDDQGREFRKKRIFYTGRKSSSVQDFRATGTVLANPRNQIATLLAEHLAPLDSLPHNPQTYRLSLEDLDDVIDRLPAVTKIRGRREAHQVALLTFGYPLAFEFEGELRPGWGSNAFIGAPRTGKSEIPRKLIRALGLGVYAVGEASTRAGLLYGIESLTAGHAIQWGLLCQADGGLLVVDGVNALAATDWVAMREARAQGVVRVNRIVSGTHPCRTRLLLLGNTKQPVSTYDYPVKGLIELWNDAPDLARLDLVVFFGEDDVSTAVINSPVEDELPNLEPLRANTARAWQVSPDDLSFEAAAVDRIYTHANALAQRFGGLGSHQVPVVGNDTKIKLARLSAACALLTGQTTVTPEHVDWVHSLMTTLLIRAKLDRFVAAHRQRLHGGEEAEIQAAVAWLTTAMHASKILKDIVQEVYWYQQVARVNEVAEAIDCDRKSARTHLYNLADHGLVRDTSRGWQRTPLFDAARKRLMEATEEDEMF